ncbi:Stress responsive A/B Barrel Domain [Bosea sp. CRIB-10]|uniref:Dabb family protein n=1 Tax=Bosea sp. CRIB-10 TaxID=378404 RepID=UPI0008E2AF2A|nr:Dabb family protein [Bosea sp. CRIB-10]PZR85908.1 MAG: Dabb family protein [Stutzerimonas stutzeri]SFB71522.1 Stress responsive A/B Barrel Domain [Bosea sp. CRIB-10]
MPGPVRHIVMWRLRGDTPMERADARAKVKAAFEGLRGRIEGLTHIEIGADVSGVDYACDVVLVSEFADRAALEAYGSHPEHLRVRHELADLRIARFQVDYLADGDAPVFAASDLHHRQEIVAGE